MPGAPNRPPPPAEVAPPTRPLTDAPEALVLRRLVPSHVALLQDSWKGGPSPEVLAPFEKAEASLRSGDLAGARAALDLLSTRFAEPRWPTLPVPFRGLRVAIPAPQPPSWDPEHSLSPSEREGRRARRAAEDQLALAEASRAWAKAHGVPVDDLALPLDSAKSALGTEGVPPEFYGHLDAFWTGLRGRLPRPKSATTPGVSATET